MAMMKKKMAAKPAMKKTKKMQEGGVTLSYNPDTDPKNALDFVGKNRDLAEVTKRETGMERLKNFYKSDFFGADSAKTKRGKDVRKILNTVAKVSYTPHALMEAAMLTGATARANKRDAKAMDDKKKMGGKVAKMAKVAKKVAPKMMMKKMSKKK
jgi:hypothetical protein